MVCREFRLGRVAQAVSPCLAANRVSLLPTSRHWILEMPSF
jgi:hypothetical protein